MNRRIVLTRKLKKAKNTNVGNVTPIPYYSECSKKCKNEPYTRQKVSKLSTKFGSIRHINVGKIIVCFEITSAIALHVVRNLDAYMK